MAKKATKKVAVKKVAAPKKSVEKDINKEIEKFKKERLKVQEGLNEKFDKDIKESCFAIEMVVNKDDKGYITDVTMRTKGLSKIEIIGILTNQAKNVM